MTKQRMAGYTPLRAKGGVKPDAAAEPAQKIETPPTASVPAAPVTEPVTSEPVPAAPPVQSAPAPEQAPAPAETAAVQPEPVPAPVSNTAASSSRQRMQGYTPLRAPAADAASTGAQVAAPAAAAAETAGVAAAKTAAPPSETPPAPAPEPAAPAIAASGAEAASADSSERAAVPSNRMQGYTPLRQREDATAGKSSESADPVAEAPVAVPVSEPVADDAAALGQPPVVEEAAEPAAQRPPAVAEPAAQAASAAQPPVAEKRPASDAQGTSKIKMKPWVKPAIMVIGAVIVALLVVLAARGLRTLEPIQDFIATYDGHSTMPDSAPLGIPAWLGWQHFLNMFFIVLIIRTGLQVRHEKRPAAMWTPKANSWFSPKGNSPKKYSLSIWTHQALDALWVLNGLVFVILLAVTGQWMRVVPTSWDVFPNMISGAIQYASLNWPVENGWIHYNALQMTSYFLVIYVAAPLAIVTGVRMSSWWPTQPKALNRVYPIELARKVHFPVMLFFVAFVLVHVFLVFTTGALKNLNHMYASRDAADAWGLVIFLVSVAVVAAAWVFMKPMFLLPVATMTGKISKN
ncbi:MULTISPECIES: cytochrome b/b6 domain-containing protein [unclassified Arthrobacter]|uniref:cytochrome b/b6 domain-containing protein n=1 Tax=unclassified Arthrobacter TaxID=235627 RepID=UPI002157A4DE|nr:MULTISPECIES: cytochrome b/b6 domain-containing protein [unclassified Arthrobacter]